MSFDINTDYPSIAHLKKRSEQRMPKFAYEYLTEGCIDDINVEKNTTDIRKIELMPYYLGRHEKSSTKKYCLVDLTGEVVVFNYLGEDYLMI